MTAHTQEVIMTQINKQLQLVGGEAMTKAITLRPHQELAITQLRQSLARGNKRIILAAPCSFGKTLVAAQMLINAAKKGKRGIFICDRVKLVQQSLAAFDAVGMKVGVIQAQHERSDYSAPVQIASMQTLAKRSRIPEFDFAIIDEAHTHYKSLTKIMEAYNSVPFIGLSATPYSKGLGKHYQDLIVPITPTELLDRGYLCPVRYYGGASVNVSGIKTKQLSTGGSDYDPKSIAQATEDDEGLTGDIIENWKKYGEDSQTIAFCPSIKHSKWLVQKFIESGVTAAHIDGYMEQEDREKIYNAHDAGEFKILSCSQLLNTGYDAPQVRCLIDCYPTKSIIVYQQRAGRIMRTSENKPNAIYLDHAGNVARHGFAENIIPESLDDGENNYNEKLLVKEKKEPKTKDCPMCHGIMIGMKCGCGYEIHIKENLDYSSESLVELEDRKKPKATKADKQRFYSGLLYIARSKGYASGWVAHTYRDYYGVWPRSLSSKSEAPSVDCKNFVLHKRIARANRRVA